MYCPTIYQPSGLFFIVNYFALAVLWTSPNIHKVDKNVAKNMSTRCSHVAFPLCSNWVYLYFYTKLYSVTLHRLIKTHNFETRHEDLKVDINWSFSEIHWQLLAGFISVIQVKSCHASHMNYWSTACHLGLFVPTKTMWCSSMLIGVLLWLSRLIMRSKRTRIPGLHHGLLIVTLLCAGWSKF